MYPRSLSTRVSVSSTLHFFGSYRLQLAPQTALGLLRIGSFNCRARWSTSSTAVQSNPHALKRQIAKNKLQQSLTELSSLNLVSQSRVQLALRCLNQENAPIRLAFLGVAMEWAGVGNSLNFPARFLRVLLADPLSPAQKWEEALSNWVQEREGAGLVLRFSPIQEPITSTTNNLLSVLPCPSQFLESHNFEILLSSLPVKYASMEDIYAPTFYAASRSVSLRNHLLGTPETVMHYPVHKTLIFSENLSELFSLAGIMSKFDNAKDNADTVLPVAPAIRFPGGGRTSATELKNGRLIEVDIDAIEAALADFRKNSSAVSNFKHKYLNSGVEDIKNWILSNTSTGVGDASPATKALISSILSNARRHAAAPAAQQAVESDSPTPQLQKDAAPIGDNLQSLTSALQSWSELSHKDLQHSLSSAFNSEEWKSLSWWKMPLNFDEIPYLANVALTNFLSRSEREGHLLAGRMWGAGFRGNASLILTSSDKGIAEATKLTVKEEVEIALKSADPDSQLRKLSAASSDTTNPPCFVTSALGTINAIHIPTLQRHAWRIIQKSIGWTSLSVFTSLLLYFSSIPLYASLSATAFGIVCSARHLQKRWGEAKGEFEREVKEEGRRAVNEGERWAWNRLRLELEKELIPKKNEEEKERENRALRKGWEGIREL